MKSFFTTNGIPFFVKDISKDQLAFNEWRHRYQGDIVPMIVFGNGERIVDGADYDAIRRILGEYLRNEVHGRTR